MATQKKRRPPAKKKTPKTRPKPRTGSKAKGNKRKPKRPSLLQELLNSLLGMGALVLIILLIGFFTYLFFSGKPSETLGPEAPGESAATPPLTYEIYPADNRPEAASLPPEPVPSPDDKPLACIIIDDIGYDKALANKFLALEAPLTFSFLPFSPFQEEIAQAAASKGIEIMLHLPMEPDEYPQVDPGPGALLTSMSPDELIRQLTEDLGSVPGAKGVNNHMGSKMTAVSSQMYQVLSILKKEGLFFIDSRTTVNTLCKPSARLLQVPFGERDIFLDHVATREFVKQQIYKLIDKAEQEGRAIGIGHPHGVTARVLEEMLPELKRKVRLIPASEMVRQLG